MITAASDYERAYRRHFDEIAQTTMRARPIVITYYKATRLDGTDFKTGKIRYVPGEIVRHPRSRRFGGMCPDDPSTYLSVSVEPGEAPLGGKWPWRLFRVEPIGSIVARTDGLYPYKRGCVVMFVAEEVPAHLAFGPYGAEVVALIERACILTADEMRGLGAARGAVRRDVRVSATLAMRNAAMDAARGAAREAVKHAAAWDTVWDAAGAAVRNAAKDAVFASDGPDLISPAAWNAAKDAAFALIVRDLVSSEHFEALYGPWRSAIQEGARQ